MKITDSGLSESLRNQNIVEVFHYGDVPCANGVPTSTFLFHIYGDIEQFTYTDGECEIIKSVKPMKALKVLNRFDGYIIVTKKPNSGILADEVCDRYYVKGAAWSYLNKYLVIQATHSPFSDSAKVADMLSSVRFGCLLVCFTSSFHISLTEL